MSTRAFRASLGSRRAMGAREFETAHARARSGGTPSTCTATVSAMDVLVVDHPLAKARLSTMRDARTDSAAFRAALSELTMMLVYEATRDVPGRTAPIHTPAARTEGYTLA